MKTYAPTLFMFLWLQLDGELISEGHRTIRGHFWDTQGETLFRFILVTLEKETPGKGVTSQTFSFYFIPYFCIGMSQGEQVEQLPSILRVQEGSSASINCSYEDSASNYFPWYKQEPGENPKLIIDIRSNMERKQIQELIVLLDKKAKRFSLHITDTQPGDSAMYFCAASAHCSTGTCSLSSNLPWGLEPHLHPVSQAFQGRICQLLVWGDN